MATRRPSARGAPRPVKTGAAVRDQDAARLASCVRRFSGRRVVVLGDLVADEFVYGDIARISREAPVPILAHHKTVVVPGGGGNAVANLHALGACPIPVGVVGRDEAGRRLLDEFKRRGIPRSTIRVAPSSVSFSTAQSKREAFRRDKKRLSGLGSGASATSLRSR